MADPWNYRSGSYKGARVNHRCHVISSFDQLLHELFADCVVADGHDGMIGNNAVIRQAGDRSKHITHEYTHTYSRCIVQKTYHFILVCQFCLLGHRTAMTSCPHHQ